MSTNLSEGEVKELRESKKRIGKYAREQFKLKGENGLTNNDYIWKVVGADGKNQVKVIEKTYDTRFGVIWFLLTHFGHLPTRFSITRCRKPYKRKKNEDIFGADDPFVANLTKGD